MSAGWLNIRAGEGQLVVVLGGFFFLMLAGLTAIGIAADTLFVAQIGAAKLPFGILLGQALVIPIVALYGRAKAGLKARWLAPVCIVIIVSVLIGLYAARSSTALIAAGGLLVLLPAIAGVLGSENGRLSASLLDSRTARRLSPVVGSIGGFGATFGAFISAQVSASLGVAALLPIGAALLATTLLPAWAAGRQIRRPIEPRRRETGPIYKNRYALVLVIAAGIVAAIATILRYQIGAAAAERYNEAEMGVFYSQLAIAINVLSIVFTAFVTRAAVGKLGAANSLLLYPGVLVAAAAAALFAPGIAAITTAVAGERLIRQNIHRTVASLAVMPLHSQIRSRVALLISGTAKPLGTIAASLLVLALSGELGVVPLTVHWQQLTWITAALALLLTGGFWFVRSQYVFELIAALHTRRLQLDQQYRSTVDIDPALKKLLLGYLASDLPERSALALELLRGSIDEDVVTAIEENWASWDAALRAQAVRTLGSSDGLESAGRFLAALSPSEPDEVRAEALVHDPSINDLAALSSVAESAPLQTRAQAIALLIDRQGVAATKGLVESLALSESMDDQRTAALTIARLKVPWLDYLIPQLLDVEPTTLLQTVAARPNEEFADACTRYLGSDSAERFAKEALLAIGEASVPALVQASTEPRLSAGALSVLGELDSARAERALRDAIGHADRSVAYRALTVAAQRPARWQSHRTLIDTEVHQSLDAAERFLALAATGNRTVATLAKSEVDFELERLFAALALSDTTIPFRQVFLAANSPDKRQRALAAETLDEYLRGKDHDRILALIESRQTKRTSGNADSDDLEVLPGGQTDIDRTALEALLASGLFGGWRLGDLTSLLNASSTADDTATVSIVDGTAVDVESVILTGRGHSSGDGVSVPLRNIYATIGTATRCGGLWLRSLAERIPDTAETRNEVTRSEMLSLATRTLADDQASADDLAIWQRVFFLRTMALTQALPSHRLRLVAEISRTIVAEPGDVIVREGRLGQHFYMVCRGRLGVTRHDGTQATLGPSDAFGALALMRGARRSQTVTAEEPSELLTIDRVDFLDLIDAHPALVRSFSRLLAARVRQSQEAASDSSAAASD
ncbi:MAG: cyclic nucleotide-binding domain-containing protein [Pseudomonadota bacterium]